MSEDKNGDTKDRERFRLSRDFYFLIIGIAAIGAVSGLTLLGGFEISEVIILSVLVAVLTVLLRIVEALIGRSADIPSTINTTKADVASIKSNTEQLIQSAATQPEILTDIDSVLDRSKSIYNRADTQVDAIWGAFPPGANLNKYYNTTLTDRISTRRIISIGGMNTVDVILDHIKRNWKLLFNEKYIIFITRPLAYEMLIADNKESAYFHFPGGGVSCIFVRSNENRFVNGVRNEWDRLKEDTTEFPATTFGEHFNEADIKTWLHEMLDKYK